MFLPARMRKLKIITLDQYSDSVVRSLHEEGITQIDDISERIQQDAEWRQILKPSRATPYTGRVSSLLMKTSGILDFLGSVAAQEKGLKDTLKEFINPPVFDKREVEELDTESLLERAEEILGKVESETRVMEEKLNELDSEKASLESSLTVAEKLKEFDIDFADLHASKYITGIAGRIPSENLDEIREKLSEITDELILFDAEGETRAERILIIITLRKHGDSVASLLRRMEFERFEISELSGRPSEVISSSETRIAEIEGERSEIISKLREINSEWEDELLVLKEQLEIEKERNEVFSLFGETEKTVMLEAWVPLKEADRAIEVVEESSEGHCVTELEEPNPEEVPVLLDNPRFAKPYENFVEMYSPLKYNEIDPTIFMAFVFPFFFGFCLTDAGYGILDALIGLILYRGLGKVNRFMRDFGIIMMSCGVWAFILGMVTNGFIGDFFPRFLNIQLPTVIPAIDAFVNPQNILIMALTVGVLHINFGLILGARNNIRLGNMREALGSQIVWLILELGIILYIFGGMFLGAPVIILAAAMLLYYNGLFGLMDVSGFLGTLLSYARLLALCLSTGGIAMTVNILTGLSYEMIPVIGVVLAPIIFVFGHLANNAFQSLGAFINSLRLHYVEFFAQFYLGGKNKFNAFRAERNFTKIRR
ncbi:V-type ATP synthase subunit I [Methanothermobacter marburgensis]|uniref:A-type ATP synthase subunit I n=1 Tax=Methanothermobacter marburgensis (strain ATCC BAA-927 / DSM 2133 / JCM 14651 / NBRC 100331 / OCM 82 / Marburg) TaxID=79929 RepID=D9PXI5_METTM|nr:V-type ATP synthase subunit I [Methanothermobacter marburgensis]ADL58933.1 A1AO ATPase, subunit I [Methanothermobacter marburgensis str. Marburg]WBF09474.1 V-type ATP synthase subunit I [Methanothermobacter marburgensis]